MPTETVTLVLDKAQYERAISEVVAGQGRLAQTGDKIGAGFIRGDRAVRVATQNITSGLLTANNAADASLVAFQSLERVFKIPLLSTVGIAAAIAGIVKLHEEVEKTRVAADAVGKQLAKSFGVQARLSSADLVTEIQAISTASTELEKRLDSTGQKIVEFFQKQQFGFSGRPQLQAQVVAAQKRESDLLNASADAQRRIIDLKQTQLDQGKDQSAGDKLIVDYENQISKILLNTPFGPITEATQKQLDNAERLLHVESSILDVENSRVKQASILKQQQTEAQSATDFFTDVGSGKFLKDIDQQKLKDQQQQQGRSVVDELRRSSEQGIPLGPNAQAILKEADRLAARQGTSIQQLVNTDFSNLLELSKYDFSGLQPLSGLTLQIQ